MRRGSVFVVHKLNQWDETFSSGALNVIIRIDIVIEKFKLTNCGKYLIYICISISITFNIANTAVHDKEKPSKGEKEGCISAKLGRQNESRKPDGAEKIKDAKDKQDRWILSWHKFLSHMQGWKMTWRM